MRKTILFLAACWLTSLWTAVGGYAQTATDDCFTITSVTVQPGGDYQLLNFGINGSRIYTAFNLDCLFPTGVDVYYYEAGGQSTPLVLMNKNGGFFPSTTDIFGDKTFTHTVSCTYGKVAPKDLRVASISNVNDNFTAESGSAFFVGVVASPYAKPGTAVLKLSGLNLTTNEEVTYNDGKTGKGKKYVPADADYPVITVGTTSTVALKISATNKYSTLVLPFDAEIPEGVKVYSCHESTADALLLKEVEAFEAYKPYILFAEGGYEGTLTGEVDASKYVEVATDGLLSGAITTQEVREGYVLQNQGSGAKFYAVDHAVFSIPEGRCWINSDAAGIRAFEFSDVTRVATPSLLPSCGEAYDLSGHRVSSLEAGRIYVVGGQKILKP